MKKKLFDELLESVREAGAIRRGELKPARLTAFPAVDTRAVRERLGVSQLAFSRMIGVSLGTLRNWEQGRRAPRGPARVLLVVAAQHSDIVARSIAEHRGSAGRWREQSNVLAFARTNVRMPQPAAFSSAGYQEARPIGVPDLKGGVDDRASGTA